MTIHQAINIFNESKYSAIGYDMVTESKSYYIFSINDPSTISDPVAVDKSTGKCFGYNPMRDGE